MPALQRPIPLVVQTGHIFRQDISFNFKLGLYAEGSCAYRFILFVNFYLIRYGDSAVQSNCTFLVHFAPLTYYNLVPATRAHEYIVTSRAHATNILICTTEVPASHKRHLVVLFYNEQDSLSDRNAWDSATIIIQNTVRTTSTDTRAQHYVEIVPLSIRSYSLGATHCVAGAQPITVHQSHDIHE